MFTCRCLNVTVTLNDGNFIAADPEPTSAKSGQFPQPAPDVIGRLVEGKPLDMASFFQEVVGPLQETNVTVQLTLILKTIPCDGWNVAKCMNCNCLVFARDALNPASLLVNASLATTPEAVRRMMAEEDYSPAYRIVMQWRSADFRSFFRKEQFRSLFTAATNTLDSTNDRNELLESLRAFMRTETQRANERIARFTQELNEQLSAVRDRAEQDYLFLAKTFVPDVVDSKRSGGGGPASTSPEAKALEPLLTNLGTPDGTAGQLETPPATPECMPMSTGNSPPSIVNGNGGQKQQGDTSGHGGFKQVAPERATLSSSAANTINNNTTNSNQGAINKPPTQQQQQHQHSTSTNLFANNHGNTPSAATTASGEMLGGAGGLPGAATRFSSNTISQARQQQKQQQSMFDSDCMFDIDGMENDKTPPPDDYSDEDENDYNDPPENNNRSEGMVIPRQHGRPSVSIAKSLPITVPKNMSAFRMDEDEEAEERRQEQQDILASIKALAKSVHGEAVFGDLPRRQIQKFSSEI